MRIKNLSIAVLLAMAGTAHAQTGSVIKSAGVPPVFYGPISPEKSSDKPRATTNLPGYSRAIMAPVETAESEAAIWSRAQTRVNEGVTVANIGPERKPGKIAAQRIAGDSAPSSPASIPELARALRGNPDLIYEFVRNNIEYVPTWGIQKGGFGALIDHQGTAFDQAALMIALLRASGHTATFVKGRIKLTAAQFTAWTGVPSTNLCAVMNLLGNAQIPATEFTAGSAGSCAPGAAAPSLYSVKVDHVWVKVNIGGTNFYFDPSFKPHQIKAGLNIAAAAGYNQASYIASATTGATVTADYVQNINRANVRNNLTSYSNALANYLRINRPAATLDDVIGGITITPHSGVLRQAVLPNQDTAVALTEWADIPANYKPTLRIQYSGIDQTYTSDAIYGRRLTITYDASSRPVLSLDGAALATGAAVAIGSQGPINFTVTHGAYTSPHANQAFAQQIKAGGTFLIGNGWGPAGRGTIELHRSALDAAMSSGAPAASESVLGASLAVLSSTWIGQSDQSFYISDRLSRTSTLIHHQVGIAGYNTASYVDLPGNIVTVVSHDGSRDKEAAVLFSNVMHSSVFESTAVQQTTGIKAVSTVTLLDKAVTDGVRVYDARAANFATAVQPNLVGCGGAMPTLQASINSGQRLILPGRCDLAEGSWTGAGFFTVVSNSNGTFIGALISGGLAGGFSATPLPPAATATKTAKSTASPSELKPSTGKTFGDPIDMARGNYLYEHEDLEAGTGDFPLSLKFARSYTSGSRNQNGPVGRGWTHNLAMNVSVASDGFQAMGEDSGLDAASAVIEKFISVDLLANPAKPVTNMLIATLGQRWFSEQMIDNTVVVKQGVNGEVFVKTAAGDFNSPPGNSSKLIAGGGNSYIYETAGKSVFAFDSTGNVATLTHPTGLQVKFNYVGNLLSGVVNSVGRSLTLTYVGGRVDTVSDGIRTVSYSYDPVGNLVGFKDALTNQTTFKYDLPGRMTLLFYPSNPAVPFMTNVYDSLGRVQTQSNAHGKLFTYYFAGSRSEEIGPYGQSRVSYLDASSKVTKSVNPLGQATLNTYDGQTRLIKMVTPEGNQVEYEYDDATCASVKRCTNNIKVMREVPKVGSGLPTYVSSFTYETNFNKVATATDRMSRKTEFTYTPQGSPSTVSLPADRMGNRPGTTYGYTAFTVAGFPTFYLQTAQTDKVNANNSVTTTTSYKASNKYVPETVVVDAGPGKLNLTSTYAFNPVGDLTQVDGPRTDVLDIATTSYNSQRLPVQKTNAAGKVEMSYYDLDGRLVRKAAQLGAQWMVSCRSYTKSGNLERVWGPALTSASTLCPAAAAPVSVKDLAYDDLDRLVRTTEQLPAGDGGNRVSETIYNLDDTVKTVTQGVGSANVRTYATYTYSPNGFVKTVKDANNNLTTYEYDGYDRKSKVRFPNPTTPNESSTTDYETFGYDASHNLTTIRKRNGQIVTLSFDNLNRNIGRTYANSAENVVIDYDLLSRRISTGFADASHSVSTELDNAGRPISITAGGKKMQYQHDAAGNLVKTTWPESTPFFVTTQYDVLNRPSVMKEMGTVNLATFLYDDLSRRTLTTLGNNSTKTTGFGNEGGLSSISINLNNTANDITWTYNRNQVGDLASSSWSNDLYQWKGYSNGTRAYTANGLNQYTFAEGASVAHDANGNLSGDGTWTYGYDDNNNLISANKAGLAASLKYDALGRLRQTVIGGQTKEMVYSGQYLATEYDAVGNVLARYIFGPDGDEPLVVYAGAGTATKEWLYGDNLGSVVAKANATGTATGVYTYGPYGEPAGTPAGRFGYAGQQYLAELGLSYVKSRFYSAKLGRFLQTDPAGMSDDLNLYAYVGNDAINSVDPNGQGRVKVLANGLLELTVKFGDTWTAQQIKAAERKIATINAEAAKGTVLKAKPNRTPDPSTIYKGNKPAGTDLDHTVDLQLNGSATSAANIGPLDSMVNRSLGAQIGNMLRPFQLGTVIATISVMAKDAAAAVSNIKPIDVAEFAIDMIIDPSTMNGCDGKKCSTSEMADYFPPAKK